MSISDAFTVLSQGYTPSIILAVIAVLLLIRQRLALDLDPREPPILKPRVPYIGHIIGLFTYHTGYYDRVFARKPMPIATLPMLNGKLYMITDPVMIQNGFRNNKLSFDPFELEFAQRMLGLSDETMVPVRFPGDEKKPSFLAEFTHEIHAAMVGEHLHKTNAAALNVVARVFNGLEKTFEVDSFYYWIRDAMTVATCEALLGSHNPLTADSELVKALWDFEGGMLGLLLNLFPSITFPKAHTGRAKLQDALIRYYSARYELEPDVSQMAKNRAALYRRHGISDIDIGKFELAMLHVSTANAIPTLFWQLCYTFADPDLTSTIRQEVESMLSITNLSNGKREATIDITKFDAHCPVLVSSYREVFRLGNAQIGSRRVMEDLMVSNGKGDEYLLRKGCDVQMPAGISHLSSGTWGPDSLTFDARRFLTPEQKGDMSAKARMADRERNKKFIPFGGGKHLCPGRNFAFAEILGAVAVLAVGFDVKGSDGELIQVPKMGRSKLGEGMAKPTGKGLLVGAKITREGWEDVEWKFVC